VLDSAKVMNNSNMTEVPYSSLLSQQYFTVFAPVNGSFNKDSLLSLCASVTGNEAVADRFIKEHLARVPYSLSSATNMKVKMMNGKNLQLLQNSIGGVEILSNRNISAKNGLLHSISSELYYVRNLYESITEIPTYSGLGSFYLQFQKDSLDEQNSIPGELDPLTGKTVYVDSVYIHKNVLLNYFGRVDREDSTYRVVVPTKTAWDAAFAKVSSYFKYSTKSGGDSLKNYFTNYHLSKDLFFNWNLQKSPQDSIVSTQGIAYGKLYPPMHVFYKPFEAGGILYGARTVSASNGLIYEVDSWNYNVENVFFNPIRVEAENTYYHVASFVNASNVEVKTKGYLYPRQKSADSISNGFFLSVTPTTSSTATEMIFSLPNTLSGKYDIFLVMLPRSVWYTDALKNKFSATLYYYNLSDNLISESCAGTESKPRTTTYFQFNSVKIDTIPLKTITFPAANYQKTPNVRLYIKSQASAKETAKGGGYTHELLIDFLYLKPRQ